MEFFVTFVNSFIAASPEEVEIPRDEDGNTSGTSSCVVA
jgi:hypothetical protein